MVKHLVDEGLIEVDPDVFTRPVVATEISVDRPSRVYNAELGAPLPADVGDLDPAVWRPVHEDLAVPVPDDAASAADGADQQ